MSANDHSADLAQLRLRVEEARARSAERSSGGAETHRSLPKSMIGMAFRIGVELVAATAIGAACGHVLDEALGTAPWLLVMLFFFGGAAGMRNVYRVAGAIQAMPTGDASGSTDQTGVLPLGLFMQSIAQPPGTAGPVRSGKAKGRG